MKSFILAAGYGTRLKPITNNLPKALVSVWGKPAISHVVDKLVKVGIREFVVNLHHLGDKIKRYLSVSYPDLKFIYSFENEILGTGGGLKKVSSFLMDDDFVIHNCDIITDMDLQRAISYHKKESNDVTLLVMERSTPRKLCFDDDMRLTGWVNEDKNLFKGDIKGSKRYAFCGIHIVNPSVFEFMPSDDVFEIFDFYIANSERIKISAILMEPRYWYDIGDLTKLNEIRRSPQF